MCYIVVMNDCLQCNNKTENPRFCSRSCAAKYNNTRTPKRQLEGSCLICNTKISSTLKYCSSLCRKTARVASRRTDQETKEANVKAVISYRKRTKIKAVTYLGGKCKLCGYDKCPEALHFHHIDPKQKDFSVSKSGNTRAWNKVKLEIDKCILLCANCHTEVHAGVSKLPEICSSTPIRTENNRLTA